MRAANATVDHGPVSLARFSINMQVPREGLHVARTILDLMAY